MWNQMSEWWCKTMHAKAMWPIHGRYICPDCHRQYPVVWETTLSVADDQAERKASNPRPRLEPVLDEWTRAARLLFQRAAGNLKRSDSL